MASEENENSFNPNENFMKTIYSKVSDLRSMLEENQPDFVLTKNQFYQTQTDRFVKKSNQENEKELLQLLKTQPSLNKIKIHELTKINREKLIINERMKHNSVTENKMKKTFSSFSNSKIIKTLKNSKKEEKTDFRSESTKKLSSNIESMQENIKTDDKSRKKMYFSTEFIKPQIKSSKPEGETNQTESESKCCNNEGDKKLKTEIKGRNDNKITRILGFLDKNHLIHKNHLNENKNMKQIKEMTVNGEKSKSEKKSLKDSLRNLQTYLPDLNNVGENRKKSVEELTESEFEEIFEFKPIGSAKTQRRPVQVFQENNSEDQRAESSGRIKTPKQKEILIVDSKMSNYSKNAADKKTYLEKGNRLREILYKKLATNSPQKNKEMVYVKEYDQWVPSEFVENNKEKLEIYLQLLLGGKKQDKSQKITLNEAEIMYY